MREKQNANKSVLQPELVTREERSKSVRRSTLHSLKSCDTWPYTREKKNANHSVLQPDLVTREERQKSVRRSTLHSLKNLRYMDLHAR